MTVCGAHGITVQADISPAEANEPIELLVLPGGMPGAANLDASPEVDRLLALAMEQGSHIGAICAAPFILGKRKLLVSRGATCYPGFEEHLLGAHKMLEKRVVTSDKFTTAVGMGAACEFGLALLVALGEGEQAGKIAESAFLPDPLPAPIPDETHPTITPALQIEAMRIGYEYGRLSTSLLQRKLSISYRKATLLAESLVGLQFIHRQEKESFYKITVDEDTFEGWASKQK
jgi:4-methyl-5(b-hydroxyethyl)-thiazole monophosphate biosynthesis